MKLYLSTLFLIFAILYSEIPEYDFNTIKDIASKSYQYRKIEVDNLNYRITSNKNKFYWIPDLSLDFSSNPYNYHKNSDTTLVANSLSSSLLLSQKLPMNSSLSLRYQLNKNGSDGSYDNNYQSTTIAFEKSFYPFELFFHESELLNFEEKISKIRYLNSTTSYQFSLISNFFYFYQKQEELKNQELGFELSKDNYETGKKKYNIGLIPEVDMFEMELYFEQRKLSYEKALDDFNRSKIQFYDFLDYEDVDFTVQIEEISTVKFTPDSTDFSTALSNSITFIQAEKDLLNSRNNIGETYRNELVTGTISASYGFDNDNDFGNYLDDIDKNGSVSLTLRVPLFNEMNFLNKLDRSNLEYKLAIENKAKILKELKTEFDNKIKSLNFNFQSLHISEKSYDLAQKIYDISKRRYEEGLITSNDFISHQQKLDESKQNLLNDKIDYLLSIYEYKKFIGEYLY
ncbi:MAG: TolC family protein [Candidatus Delongbacteria bacterium]|nr:TolC family protein [Candidatus Delongbacteria bacterium]MBN2836994.1 TolC family protein [Candidatus Delongbacteria bacterium]